MSSKIMCRNTLDAVENIGFLKGEVLSVNYEHDTASLESNAQPYYDIPVFYNAPIAENVQKNDSIKSSSKAFCRGDEVIARMYKGEPSHIIGFTGDLWPCVKVPAFTFNQSYMYDEAADTFTEITSPLFNTRYKTLTKDNCSKSFTTYINQPDADISTGFVSSQTHWTDSKYHRESKFYYNGELIYTTYNNETFSHYFNGTRSNILGSYIHPDSGWGALIYQVDTFYNWRPLSSGRVIFDYYLYTSTGTHTKLATAEADITGASVQASGMCVDSVNIYSSKDSFTGEILSGTLKIYEAGIFSSDGSTNILGKNDCKEMLLISLMNGAQSPEVKISKMPTNIYGAVKMPDGGYSDGSFEIYIKNR